jgi:AMP deaminase
LVPSTHMIRSHSATGSLHAPQLNPIAANILRKEPEHETFSRIYITAVGMDHFHSFIYLI